VQALKDEGLRDNIFVMVGGAPVTETFAKAVGADAYGRDAAVAVELAKAHMVRRREQRVAQPA
jgi:methanogenic corrinoid protein MtbC1